MTRRGRKRARVAVANALLQSAWHMLTRHRCYRISEPTDLTASARTRSPAPSYAAGRNSDIGSSWNQRLREILKRERPQISALSGGEIASDGAEMSGFGAFRGGIGVIAAFRRCARALAPVQDAAGENLSWTRVILRREDGATLVELI